MEKTTLEETLSRRELALRLGMVGLTAATAALLPEEAQAQEQSPASPPDVPKPHIGMKHDMTGYGIPSGPPQQIAVVLYPQMTALDLVGPTQMLAALGNVEVHYVAETRQPVVSDMKLSLVPTCTFAECPAAPLVLLVPGGSRGTIAQMNNPAMIKFLKRVGPQAKWVTSVCTGSLLLGAAGLLNGYRATSHWSFRDEVLPLLGATPVAQRVVRDRNRMTGAGVTAGLDFALQLAALLRNEKMAQAIQLGMEYDPAPPYHAGTKAGAMPAVSQMMEAMISPTVESAQNAARRAMPKLEKVTT